MTYENRTTLLLAFHGLSLPRQGFRRETVFGRVTVPNSLWDNHKARGLYQEYIDQLAYADELGFDGMVLNEHHQNIYGLMPSPNLIASALTQRTTRGKIIILGNLLPLHMNPMRVAVGVRHARSDEQRAFDRRLRARRRPGDF